MRRQTGWTGLLLAGLLSLAVGCGGDDDDDTSGDDGGDTADGGDGGDGGDGDGSDTTLDQLSDAEATQFCEEILGELTVEDFLEFFCTAQGLAQFPDDPEACDGAVAECIKMAEIPVDDLSCAVDPEEVAELPECASEITVGEMQDCLEEVVAAFESVIAAVTCESDPENLPELPVDELPEACAAIEEQCPELFDDSE